MYGRQRSLEIAAKRKARREREDSHSRLRDVVPKLATLYFEVSSRQGKTTLSETKHVRRFVVDQAPALFELHCTNAACVDGGHDVTRATLDALRKQSERFEIDEPCQAACGRALQVVGVATYR